MSEAKVILLKDLDPNRPLDSYPEDTVIRLIDDSGLEEELDQFK